MKKQEVTKVNQYEKMVCYRHKDYSNKIPNKQKPSTHPCHSQDKIKAFYKLVDGIKPGDIIRCDGIPYQSRPKAIYIDRSTFLRPVKLESKLWVLRKTTLKI